MALLEKAKITEDLGVSIRALLLAKGRRNIDKAQVVLHTPLGPACHCLLFLLLGHLGSLTSHFPSTGQGTMDFTSKHAISYFQGAQSLYPTLAPWVASFSRGMPARSRTWSSGVTPSDKATGALIWATVSRPVTLKECVAPRRGLRAACWRLDRGHRCRYHKDGVEKGHARPLCPLRATSLAIFYKVTYTLTTWPSKSQFQGIYPSEMKS